MVLDQPNFGVGLPLTEQTMSLQKDYNSSTFQPMEFFTYFEVHSSVAKFLRQNMPLKVDGGCRTGGDTITLQRRKGICFVPREQVRKSWKGPECIFGCKKATDRDRDISSKLGETCAKRQLILSE